ncbi:aminotransferase [Pseudomonas japonica]|uniref:aminotransferase n=1 Tax=Pseudomonas japonica TaxID=256466 RepID=UPI0015E3CB29|nr:aminotransferase [Pseudomonas japonica]MBA1241328.1 aminotransferase [Pseudomonas japonica]
MSLHELIQRSSLPNPHLSTEDAQRLLLEHYAIDGELEPLGSQQDLNFRVQSTAGRFVLKACHGSYGLEELQAQHAALEHLAAEGLAVPRVMPTLSGHKLLSVTAAGQALHVRLFEYLEGEPLTRRPHLGIDIRAAMGRLCAETDRALAGFSHPGLERTLQWDPRQAAALVEQLLPVLADQPERLAQVRHATQHAQARLAALIPRLPSQAVHLDLTDDNTLWQRTPQRGWMLKGIIDFGDLCRTWRIADLSVTCAALLHHCEGDPFGILPAVTAYQQANPLTEAELRALWPLIVNRAAVLVLSTAQQLKLNPQNPYLHDNAAHEWEVLDVALSVAPALMENAVLAAAGMPCSTPNAQGLGRLLPGLSPESVNSLDLSVLSPLWNAGNWEEEGAVDRQLAGALAGFEAAASRYGEYYLAQTRPDIPAEPETFALHVQLLLAAEQALEAPFPGQWSAAGKDRWMLVGEQWALQLDGQLSDTSPGAKDKGQQLGQASGMLRIQLMHAGIDAPAFTTPSRASAWAMLCPSPAAVLGWACDAPAQEDSQVLLARRDASFARSQKYYYQAPPRIERGWRNHLIDMQGRSYLDMLNNVAVLGHGHPRMAQVAARQWSLLNTNSRFHYAALAEFSERLLALAPSSMDRVFLVNSGSEANDLAIRLAWAYSGGRDVLSVLEAYHGWTVATDAISTSIADNPKALETRPQWVHPVMAPNTYRGTFRGPGSTADYLRSVTDTLANLDAQQRQVAGFICEPVYGNAGGIALPPGYLEQVYAQVRARGGVCIADEVQVGYGRLGTHFWGFEEQGVVPDIITMAKGMGNGQPLGVVITRREIAEALEAEGYFFSSAGGSPVSCEIGMAVLDVMEEEGLWENARVTGGYFKQRLEELVERFPLAGAAHGSGFYLGLELVRDRATLEPATEETALLCERLRDLGIFMQPTGDYLNILKIKPPMCTTRRSVDFFVDSVAKVLAEDL